MDENKSITYDDLIQTRNTQILKVHRTIFRRSDTKAACHADPADGNGKNATAAFSRQENSMAACSLPAGTKTAGCNA